MLNYLGIYIEFIVDEMLEFGFDVNCFVKKLELLIVVGKILGLICKDGVEFLFLRVCYYNELMWNI